MVVGELMPKNASYLKKHGEVAGSHILKNQKVGAAQARWKAEYKKKVVALRAQVRGLGEKPCA
jgi:cobalamin biosynthesis Co2+ chelatase CbiK